MRKRYTLPPTTFSLTYCDLAYAVTAELGATLRQVAKVLNVGYSTVKQWQRKVPEFHEALKQGRDAFDSRNAESKLLQRALGYEYTEVVEEDVTFDTRSNGKKISIPATKRKVHHKQMAPDVTAIMFWLQNRNPERWKNVSRVEARVEHNHTGGLLVADLAKLGKRELEDIRASIAKTVAPESTDSRTS